MPLKQIVAPYAPPLDVVEARLHVRQDIADDDAKLGILIRAARDFAETETQRAIVATRFQQVLDSFPSPSLMGVPFGRPYTLPGHAIQLERSPLIQVVSIQYFDMGGVLQTMPATDYAIDDSGTIPRITPVFGKIWPIPLPQIGAVRVTYDAGYCAPLVADDGTDAITIKGWKPLAVNDVVRLSNSGGELPEPLQPDTDYYVQAAVSAGVYKLSATVGGAAIDLTGIGTGTHYVGSVPEGLKAWMSMRIDSMYNNRGEIATTGGKFEPLPYIDRLLDPFRALTA
jgi:uncharacterized phiE125 gp8 family phage protein